MRVPLSLACGVYDRTFALARGDIQPEGIDLTYLALPVEETFFRMTRHREFRRQTSCSLRKPARLT